MITDLLALKNGPFIALLLPFAGSVLGLLLASSKRLSQNLSKDLILVFSGAFLLAITLIELLPQAYTLSASSSGYWILLGVLLQIILEYFSQGAEHGHVHLRAQKNFPYALWISLCIHAFIEGLPLTEYPHLALGMAIHKIPIAVVLYLLLKNLPIRSLIHWGSLLVFAIMSSIGGIVFYYVAALQSFNGPILGVVIGVLLHIATTIIFESTEGHHFNRMKLGCIVLATLLAALL